jgi:hypothetical protein
MSPHALDIFRGTPKNIQRAEGSIFKGINLPQITAAAYIQGNPGDITRFIGRKKNDPGGNFLHRAEPSQRDLS